MAHHKENGKYKRESCRFHQHESNDPPVDT